MFGLSGHEFLLVMVVAGLLFGAKKLPELGRAVGESLREFRKSTREIAGDDRT